MTDKKDNVVNFDSFRKSREQEEAPVLKSNLTPEQQAELSRIQSEYADTLGHALEKFAIEVLEVYGNDYVGVLREFIFASAANRFAAISCIVLGCDREIDIFGYSHGIDEVYETLLKTGAETFLGVDRGEEKETPPEKDE